MCVEVSTDSASGSILPSRNRPAHPPQVRRGNDPVIVHVTTCLRNRQPILDNERVHVALREVWGRADHWVVGSYVVMPDHVHLFCSPGRWTPVAVRDWVKYWRSLLSRRLPELKGKWLPDCWDTQMRNARHYRRKLEYAADNPVRAGLVALAAEWPYRGRLTELRW